MSSFSVIINIGLNSHAYFDTTPPYDLFNWAAARELHSENCDDKIIVRRVAHSALNILNSEVFLIRKYNPGVKKKSCACLVIPIMHIYEMYILWPILKMCPIKQYTIYKY